MTEWRNALPYAPAEMDHEGRPMIRCLSAPRIWVAFGPVRFHAPTTISLDVAHLTQEQVEALRQAWAVACTVQPEWADDIGALKRWLAQHVPACAPRGAL